MQERIVKNLEEQELKIEKIARMEVELFELGEKLCFLEQDYILKTDFKSLGITTKSGKVAHIKSIDDKFKSLSKNVDLLKIDIEKEKELLSLLKKQYHFYIELL